MGFANPQHRHQRPDRLTAAERAFRIWRPEADAPAPSNEEPPLSADSRLSEYHRRFHLPIVLKIPREQFLTHGNAVSHTESVDKWVALMGDPPLRTIVDADLVDFEERLRKHVWRRGKTGVERRLAEFTIFKHVKQVSTELRHCGPKLDRRRAYACLLSEAPYLSIATPELEESKPPFAPGEPAEIFKACSMMTQFGVGGGGSNDPVRRGDGGAGADDFWRGVVATFYWTGFRYGTLRRLAWPMIEERDEGRFFNVPAWAMKNGKPRLKFIRDDLWCLLSILRERRSADDAPVFEWPHSDTHFRDRHKFLQVVAGFHEHEPLSIHAWRRTHADALDDLGADQAGEQSQRSLDHADKATTLKHYLRYWTKTEPRYLKRLPPLFEFQPRDPSQGLFFEATMIRNNAMRDRSDEHIEAMRKQAAETSPDCAAAAHFQAELDRRQRLRAGAQTMADALCTIVAVDGYLGGRLPQRIVREAIAALQAAGISLSASPGP